MRGKKLTAKEIVNRGINKIVQRIRNIEKDYPQELIESACFRYKNANVQKRNALKDMQEAEEKLREAKAKLENGRT